MRPQLLPPRLKQKDLQRSGPNSCSEAAHGLARRLCWRFFSSLETEKANPTEARPSGAESKASSLFAAGQMTHERLFPACVLNIATRICANLFRIMLYGILYLVFFLASGILIPVTIRFLLADSKRKTKTLVAGLFVLALFLSLKL